MSSHSHKCQWGQQMRNAKKDSGQKVSPAKPQEILQAPPQQLPHPFQKLH